MYLLPSLMLHSMVQNYRPLSRKEGREKPLVAVPALIPNRRPQCHFRSPHSTHLLAHSFSTNSHLSPRILKDEALLSLHRTGHPRRSIHDPLDSAGPLLVFLLSTRISWRVHGFLYQDCCGAHSAGRKAERTGEQLYGPCVQSGWSGELGWYDPSYTPLHRPDVIFESLLRYNSSTAVLITDQEYPVRPAFSLLAKIIEEFATAVPQTSYSNPSSIAFPAIHTYLQKYQDPKQADAIMKVQAELDETKIILVCEQSCSHAVSAD
jgi:hypothetical protein